MRDYDELVARLKQSDDNCNAEHDECPAECDSPGYTIFLEAADAIEELLKEVQSRENDCINLTGECATYYAQIPKWHPVSEPPTRSNPKYAREDFLVRLESGRIMSLTYEFDNSDRCCEGCEPLFPVGWRKTERPVTHWTEMPKFKPPKEET